MLSRILHRNKTAPAPSSPEEELKAIAATIKSRVEPRSTVSTRDVDFFVQILLTFAAREDAKYVTDRLLDRLATSNTNTSYIEPYVESAYKNSHPDRDFLGNIYASFAASFAAENNSTMLVYKMLDERFYASKDFPVHSFALLGQNGVTVPENVQENWLFRALASNVPVDLLVSCAGALKLDPNSVKDKQHRTVLHSIMDDFNTTKDAEKLTHLLSRAKAMGIAATPDIFGRRPEDFGTAQAKLIFAQHFATVDAPKNALAAYLADTMHNFGGVHYIGPQDVDAYAKGSNPLQKARPTTLFKHVLESNDMDVISELQSMILPRTQQHSNFEKMLPYVFLERYVCGSNPNPDVAQAVFDMMLDKSPRDLSTALGYLLMRSDAYYKNYDVNIQNLGMFLPAIERIVDYQKTQGLHDLVNLETPAIERLAAPVASVSMAP